MGVTEESDENSCEGSVGFGEEGNVVCENECHAVFFFFFFLIGIHSMQS